MNAHVFTTNTSASSARDVISIPRCKTLPSIISASTRFLAQPRLIMPTFVLIQENPPSALLDGDVGVVRGHDLSILFDLNGFPIEHAHIDVLPLEFDRSIGWGKHTIEVRSRVL